MTKAEAQREAERRWGTWRDPYTRYGWIKIGRRKIKNRFEVGWRVGYPFDVAIMGSGETWKAAFAAADARDTGRVLPDVVKLTANERRALRQFAKPRIDWDLVHGHTLHSLERKKLVQGRGGAGGWELTAAGRAELEIPDIFADLFERKDTAS